MARPSPDTIEVRLHESLDRVSSHVSQSFSTYKKQVFIGVLATLLLVFLIVAGLQWQRNREAKALLAFYRLSELEKRTLASNTPDPTAKKGEEQEMKAAFLPRLEPEKAKELETAYRDALSQHGKTKAGRFLHYQLANILSKSGRHAEAIPEYVAFYKDFSMASPYRGLGLVGAGFAALEAGKNEEARGYLSEANALEVNPQKDVTLFLLGKTEEKMGEKLKAQTRYETLVQDFGQSPLANLARERLFQLKQSHPETAEKQNNGAQVKTP